MLCSRRRRDVQEGVTSRTDNAASSRTLLPFPSYEKMGETVRGLENNPETLGIPDKEDWILRTVELNSETSEARRGSLTAKCGGTDV